MQIKKPVTVAARNPANDFRGANLIAGMSGKCAGKGGVYFPQSLPIVEAVVSDHDRLNVSLFMARQAGNLREDRNHGDISRVEGEDKDDADEVVHHSIDLISFTLSHQEAEVILPNFCESRVFQSE